MRNQARIGAVVHHGGGGAVIPFGDHLADQHLAVVERLLKRALIMDARVRVPFFDRSINLKDLVVMAPRQYVITAASPSEVYDEPAGGYVFRKCLSYVYRSDLLLGIAHAFFDPYFKFAALVGKVDYGYIFTGYIYMFQKHRQGAF